MIAKRARDKFHTCTAAKQKYLDIAGPLNHCVKIPFHQRRK